MADHLFSKLLIKSLLVISTLSLLQYSFGQNAVLPGELIIEPPTLICLGFEWKIEGDINRNAQVEVTYRPAGTEHWKRGMDLLRIGGEEAGTPELNYVTPHMFAGSIIDLEENTTYECRLVIRDPDGVIGDSVKIVNAKTRPTPTYNPNRQVRHVYPKNWEGEKETPAYDGLLHAYYGYPRFADWNLTADPVQPGDIIKVHAGTYKADRYNYRDYHGLTFHGTYFLTQRGTEAMPITIQAAGDGEVVFDGNGAYRLFDVKAADHHIIQGITIKNAEIAILAGERDAQGCDGLVVRNCRIEDVGIGIMAQYQGSKNFYIADNVILGKEDRTKLVPKKEVAGGGEQQRVESYYGVKLYGQGHVVCYNYVAYFFDGIDICTHGTPEADQDMKSVAIDFYNNDIFLMNDNFIEADGGTHNIRILRNRCANASQAGFTNQPVMGGPVYWIRNISYNTPLKPAFKFWGMRPAGVVAYHNTTTTYNARHHKAVSNIHLRNNLFLPPSDDSNPILGLMTYTAYSSTDHNGYRFTKRAAAPIIWHAPQSDVMADFKLKCPALEYKSLKSFSKDTGQELHAIEVDYDDFINVQEPSFKAYQERNPGFFPIYDFEEMDFRLSESSKAIDAGVLIPNVNDNYTGNAPDLGAYEYGQDQPHYGPRNKNKY